MTRGQAGNMDALGSILTRGKMLPIKIEESKRKKKKSKTRLRININAMIGFRKILREEKKW